MNTSEQKRRFIKYRLRANSTNDTVAVARRTRVGLVLEESLNINDIVNNYLYQNDINIKYPHTFASWKPLKSTSYFTTVRCNTQPRTSRTYGHQYAQCAPPHPNRCHYRTCRSRALCPLILRTFTPPDTVTRGR